jgi:hypothetical protein
MAEVFDGLSRHRARTPYAAICRWNASKNFPPQWE